jgi:2-haloacid dehalogenase
MNSFRRHFLHVLAGSSLAGAMSIAGGARAGQATPFKAIAFDAFPIFDPRPAAATAESVFPGQGSALINAWRVRLFEYQWLRALAGRYVDFMQATRDSLKFAASQLQLSVSTSQEETLMSPWSNLQVWPDAAEAIRTLREAGLRLAFLSNMTQSVLDAGLKKAELSGSIEAVISTDRIRSYKPDPRAYQLGVDAMRLPKEQILFVAFAGWDVAGAKWFGYPTFWCNRGNAPLEMLDATPDAMGPDLAALVKYVSAGPRP